MFRWRLVTGLLLVTLALAQVCQAAPTTITLWAAGLPGSFNQWVVEQFPKMVEKAYPDIRLEVTVIPGRQNLEDKRLVAAASGVGPDIFHESGNFGPESAYNGSALALDSYLAQWPDYRDVIKLSNWDYKGHTYGVPYGVNITGVGYWEDMLQESAVAPPANWDDLVRATRKLTRQGSEPGVLQRAGLSMWEPFDIWGGLYPFTVFTQQLGSQVFSADYKKPQFNTDTGRRALTYLSELTDAARPGGLKPASEFGSRGSAMQFWFSNWHTPTMIDQAYTNDESKRLRLIKIPGPKGASDAVGITQSFGWMISAKSKHADLAFKVIQYFLQNDVQTEFVKAFSPGGILSPRRSFRYPATWPYVQDSMKMTEPPLVNEWGPLHPFFGDVISVAPAPLYEGVSGKRSVQSALEETDRLLSVMLAEKMK